jgi:DNA oxidative demethylase
MQRQLFDDPAGPSGFEYRADFITATEERCLLDEFARLPFTHVEMRGVVARRETAHFGWTYGYYSRRASTGPPLPAFLVPYRDRAAHWAGIEPDRFVEALVTKYPEGAPIGWHRDAPMFGDVIAGISLGAPCRMKFRPYVSPAETGGVRRQTRRTTHDIDLAPRSGYLIAGVARRDFEHSIPAVAAQRYSITFRTLRDQRSTRR